MGIIPCVVLDKYKTIICFVNYYFRKIIVSGRNSCGLDIL